MITHNTDNTVRPNASDSRDLAVFEIMPLLKGDAEEATRLMTRAFDDDSRRHFGTERGGPPGYDTGAFIGENAFSPGARAFKALVSGEIAGVIIVFPHKNGHHFLGCMFTDPERQRAGIGRALFQHVESLFPARSWSLETPLVAKSNHAFYERTLGFERVGEKADGDGPAQALYRKNYPH